MVGWSKTRYLGLEFRKRIEHWKIRAHAADTDKMDTFPALHQSLLLKNCPYKREGPRGNFCVTLQTLDQRLATRPPIPPYILEMQASLPSNQNFTMGQEQQWQQNENHSSDF